MDSNDEIEIITIAIAMATVALYYHETYAHKNKIRNSPVSGHEYIHDLVRGHPEPFHDILRMDQHIFLRLCKILEDRGLLKMTKQMSVVEQVAICLITVGHNERNRMIRDRFQHSGETISRHFNNVLRAISEFSISMIRPPSFAVVPSNIRRKPK
ncbi:hypothetical protein ACHQM5_019231 [Ranunculus cassubicifolius]